MVVEKGKRVIDLTNPIQESTFIAHVDNPPVVITKWQAGGEAGKAGWLHGGRCWASAPQKTVSQINMGPHSGTHVDAPLHMVIGGKTIEQFPVDTFHGWAVIAKFMDKKPGEEITGEDLERAVGDKISPGDILILYTGFDDRTWGPEGPSKEYREAGRPWCTKNAAEWMIKKGIKMVGGGQLGGRRVPGTGPWTTNQLLYTNPEELNRRGAESAHNILLAHDIPLIENLNLKELVKTKADRFYLYALPILIKGVEAGPCRAIAIID